MTINAINWNNVPELEKEVWERVTKNFWLDTNFPISNDISTWRRMSPAEQKATMHVFANLALLDTLQTNAGLPAMNNLAESDFERAVFSQFQFMEAVHAKSYSSIFQTLSSTPEIDSAFAWVAADPYVQNKAGVIAGWYESFEDDDELDLLLAMAASVMLESFLFFSGFYLPFKMSSQGKLTNTADVIRAIVADEAIHGYYIGQKFQERFRRLDKVERSVVEKTARDLLEGLMDEELRFTEEIYDDLGWTEGAKRYLRYNANKALHNLGFEERYPAEEARVEPAVLTQVDPSKNEAHDFFSGAGSAYTVATREETSDDDWD